MDTKQLKSSSRFLSLVLRHSPQEIGIQLDDSGWTSVDGLLAALDRHGKPITREYLEEVVRTNDKQRFAFSDDGQKIRASQGHSIDVNLGYQPAEPPATLLHGTYEQAIPAILREGLKKMKRHHVHLHEDAAIATNVGARRGAPIILQINSQQMAAAGFQFFVTANNVWLTDHVPPEFICRNRS